ncbi:MAG TPA: hypothetical protein VK525_17660 [Candidatus Saccharimonadales bacterium]|nr:hypothetical protein [Candidatus Saccharimonadales bacterium]
MTEAMPNRAIEIHDSVLAAVSFSHGEAQLHFSSVYIHQSEGAPLRDAGSGWVQKAVLRIQDARVEGAFSEFPVDLSSGQIQMGQNILDNEIPVPLRHRGAFELRLQAMWQGQIVVSFKGSRAELELLGEPEYVEEIRP